MARVLIAARLSQGTGEESRIERDDLAAREWADRNGHDVIATSADYVSGGTNPFEREHLGPWLTDPAKIAQWDIIVASKLDRLARSVRYLHDLQQWCDEHTKRIVVIDQRLEWPVPTGNAGFASDIQWALFGRLAQWELEIIKERYEDAKDTVRANGGYLGRPPFGFEMGSEGKYRKTLVLVRSLVPVLQGMVERALRGDTLLSIAQWLDTVAPKDAKWNQTSVKQILKNPALKGRQYDRDGRVSYKHEGVLTSAEWDELQKAMNRGSGRRSPATETAMLTGSITCALCGGPMYRIKSATKRKDGTSNVNFYYRCKGLKDSEPSTCKNMVKQADIEDWLDLWFTGETFGGTEIVEVVTINGDGHESEIAEIAAEIRDLDLDDPKYLDKQAKLLAERKRLQEMPATPTEVREVPTGKTVGDVWASLDHAARRRYLLATGLKVMIQPGEVRNRWLAGGNPAHITQTLRMIAA